MKLEKTMISWAFVLFTGIAVVAGEEQKPVASDAAAVAKANSMFNVDKDRLEKICSPDALSFKDEIDVLKKAIGSQDRKMIDRLFAALKKKYADEPSIQLKLLFMEAAMLQNYGWDKERQPRLWREASTLGDSVQGKQGIMSQQIHLELAKSLIYSPKEADIEEAKKHLQAVLDFSIFSPPYYEDINLHQGFYIEAAEMLVQRSRYSELDKISVHPFANAILAQQYPEKYKRISPFPPGVAKLRHSLETWLQLESKSDDDLEYQRHVTAVLEHLQKDTAARQNRYEEVRKTQPEQPGSVGRDQKASQDGYTAAKP
jgi:hypothetical protein